MNSIWEKISSNDTGVNGVLCKYLSIYQFGDMNNISKMFRQLNSDISTSPVLHNLFFSLLPQARHCPHSLHWGSQSKARQTPKQSVSSQHCCSCYTWLDFSTFPWTVFPRTVAISVTPHQKTGGRQRGAEGLLAEDAVLHAGCSLCSDPPGARVLSGREGQLQLACPFSLFLLDLLALDLKLWLLLKLLLKNKFHMHYPSSALDTE